MSKHRHNHYVLVDIGFPVSIAPELAAELVETALQTAIDEGALSIVHGNGPNPPYEGAPEYLRVFPDERP